LDFGAGPLGDLGESRLLEIRVVVKVAAHRVSASMVRGKVVGGLAILEAILLIAGTTNEVVVPILFEPRLIAIAGIALANVTITWLAVPIGELRVVVVDVALFAKVEETTRVRVRIVVNGLGLGDLLGNLLFTNVTFDGGCHDETLWRNWIF